MRIIIDGLKEKDRITFNRALYLMAGIFLMLIFLVVFLVRHERPIFLDFDTTLKEVCEQYGESDYKKPKEKQKEQET
jgi:hypothetical protein